MKTLHYVFDGENFDYDVSSDDIKQELYEWMLDNWSHDEMIDYILDNDGCMINLFEDFKEELHEIFEVYAEEDFYESKNADNGVDQEDFVDE